MSGTEMNGQPASARKAPARRRVLDGSVLKVLAVVTMLLDHTASVLMEDTYYIVFRFGARTVDLYELMRLAGRISFPLYAFLLVEGFLHTRNVKRYAGGLLILALLSEIPWNLVHSGSWLHISSQNVLFTLLFGLLGLWVIRDCQGDLWKKALLLFGLLALSVVFHADYGVNGFGFIIMLYLLRDQALCRALVGCCMLPSLWKAGVAFSPISLYNGKRGFIRNRALQYAFYLIYPVHMLVLYWIRLGSIGY